jgi:APA family basic amino acid/polyamine antiporter
MDGSPALIKKVPPQSGKLLRILGLGFGLAIGVGATIGVGILRSPGEVAKHLPSSGEIMLAWGLGGVYCLLVANCFAELATMMPKAGGFCVYADRAMGKYAAFVVGWSDFLSNALGLAYIAVTFGEYTVSLFVLNCNNRAIFSISILIVMTILNWLGLRIESKMQNLFSLLKAIALLAFIGACFIYGGQGDAVPPQTAVATPSAGFFAPVIAFILAFKYVLAAYEGWHSAIYFAEEFDEEDADPVQNIPRSIFGGLFSVIFIYLFVNLALLWVLSPSQLASSTSLLPASDAMTVIFKSSGGQIVTILALLSIIGVINALLLMIPRILLALGRAGLFTQKAKNVNQGGTPTFGLLVTALFAIVFAYIGSFDALLAVSQFFLVLVTIILIISLFILRFREPDTPRPFRAWGYPVLPLVTLILTVLVFFGYIYSILRSDTETRAPASEVSSFTLYKN